MVYPDLRGIRDGGARTGMQVEKVSQEFKLGLRWQIRQRIQGSGKRARNLSHYKL